MCEICDGATPEEARANRARSIDTNGWGIIGVQPSPQNEPWAYTVGLVEAFEHPELIVVGIDLDIAGLVLHDLATCVTAGVELAPGRRAPVVGIEVEFAEVHPAQFGHGVFTAWFDHYRVFKASDLPLSALQVVPPAELGCCDHPGCRPRLDLPERTLDRRRPSRVQGQLPIRSSRPRNAPRSSTGRPRR
jgi:hypothetical protein